MARFCEHVFVPLDNKYGVLPPNNKPAAVVACVFCGQVREVYQDGIILITVESGEVSKKKLPTSTNEGTPGTSAS